MRYTAIVALLITASTTVFAQRFEVEFDPIEGPPCIARSIDRENIYNAPTQRAQYALNWTFITAVVVAGSGREPDNSIVRRCALAARNEIPNATTSQLRLVYEDYSQQVRQCIAATDRRLQVYEIFFNSEEKCLSTPSRTTATCMSTSASTAYCDLAAGSDGSSVTFLVEGNARARSNGTRTGSMQLVMTLAGQPCNSKADQIFSVDNATDLKGDGFMCTIILRAGQRARVVLTAPNSRADAEFIRATASYSARQR